MNIIGQAFYVNSDTLFVEASKLYTRYKVRQLNLKYYDDEQVVERRPHTGSGSLYDHSIKAWCLDPYKFNNYISDINDTYIKAVCENIVSIIENDGYVSGRIRLLKLDMKTCLTYHVDTSDVIRYHIPIVTNDDVFFIIDDKVERMPVAGKLYSFDPRVKHTAVNASRQERIHLVFDVLKGKYE